MSDVPASPRASRLATPGWLDGRLVLGVLLVLVSVVVGARVLSAADRSTLVWAAGADLTAGTQLQPGDLRQVRVRLLDGVQGSYVPVSQSPEGLVLERGLESGELLPRRALLSPQEDVDFRLVTVAVDAARFPSGLRAAQQVDVWLTPDSAQERAEQAAADPARPPAPDPAPADDPAAPTDGQAGPAAEPGVLQLDGAQPVLLRVVVAEVPGDGGGFGGGSTTRPVVLQVRPDDVERLVSSMSLGRLDLVRVPQSAERQDVVIDGAAAGGGG